eukprot:gene29812-38428_t
MKIKHPKALIAALVGSASILPFLPFVARAEVIAAPDFAASPEEVIVKGQRLSPNVPTTTEGVTAEAL